MGNCCKEKYMDLFYVPITIMVGTKERFTFGMGLGLMGQSLETTPLS
jgi:hypothetical protein